MLQFPSYKQNVGIHPDHWSCSGLVAIAMFHTYDTHTNETRMCYYNVVLWCLCVCECV